MGDLGVAHFYWLMEPIRVRRTVYAVNSQILAST
ncbi:hypothetical protein AF70_00005840 [Pseudomonas sp. KD5]|jgi:hypothetical protein|uniref:Uncharacterized protein n=1 Tax=Pseudomonas umsongensis TaxID=198618 RepID=A0ACC5M9N6_9PSED|nr:hypothetical protein [Pseudomonas umsongensis]NMN75061.1 hypothetical protein [Pseudomonas sp. KD5]